jgi:ketosteroid isomerase-like protein
MAQPSTEDWLGINDLFTRYSMALDDGDVDGVVACFTADATVESPVVGTYAGLAKIRQFAERIAAVRRAGTQLRHVVSNLAAEVDGDRARARCYLVTYITRDGRSALLAPGEYNCELVKTGNRWRFSRRVVAMDSAITLPGG